MILAWALGHIQDDDGGSVYLRLSTRPLDQPERGADAELRDGDRAGRLLAGPARARRRAWPSSAPASSPPRRSRRTPRFARTSPRPGLLVVTSAGRLHADWLAAARAPGRRRARRPARTSSACSAPLAPRRAAGDRARRPPGDALLAGRRGRPPRRGRWASSGSASPATSPTSTATTASIPGRSSTRPPARAWIDVQK